MFGWKVWGSWRPLPRDSMTLFFRVNGDSRLVFRGLGRESGLWQSLFPTFHSTQNLRDIMGTYDDSRSALERFDGQLRTGEKIRHVGQIVTWTGPVVAASIILFKKDRTGVTVAAVTGVSMVILGPLIDWIGEGVARKAVIHLDDAIEYLNAHYSRQTPRR